MGDVVERTIAQALTWPMSIFGCGVAMLAMVALSLPAQAQMTHLHPERIAAINIRINDEVSDGCWPRPKATQETVELVFRQAGVLVANKKKSWVGTSPDRGSTLYSISEVVEIGRRDETIVWNTSHPLHINGLGWGLTPTKCAVVITWHLKRVEGVALVHDDRDPMKVPGLVLYDEHMFLVTGPKAQMQTAITERVTEFATSLANAILKAREEKAAQ